MITEDAIKAIIESHTVILIYEETHANTGKLKRLSYDTLNDTFIITTIGRGKGIPVKDISEAAKLYNSLEI